MLKIPIVDRNGTKIVLSRYSETENRKEEKQRRKKKKTL
jgi:hypothetical protein